MYILRSKKQGKLCICINRIDAKFGDELTKLIFRDTADQIFLMTLETSSMKYKNKALVKKKEIKVDGEGRRTLYEVGEERNALSVWVKHEKNGACIVELENQSTCFTCGEGILEE